MAKYKLTVPYTFDICTQYGPPVSVGADPGCIQYEHTVIKVGDVVEATLNNNGSIIMMYKGSPYDISGIVNQVSDTTQVTFPSVASSSSSSTTTTTTTITTAPIATILAPDTPANGPTGATGQPSTTTPYQLLTPDQQQQAQKQAMRKALFQWIVIVIVIVGVIALLSHSSK